MSDQRRKGNSRLIAAGGEVSREQLFEEGPIQVRFRGAILSPAGEIQQVEIRRDGNVIGLTAEQARSLAKQINFRLGK